MAKMIPSVISPEVKSNAEKRIFEWFRDDPKTVDWIVFLHRAHDFSKDQFMV